MLNEGTAVNNIDSHSVDQNFFLVCELVISPNVSANSKQRPLLFHTLPNAFSF
jgi:hypothetical protein